MREGRERSLNVVVHRMVFCLQRMAGSSMRRVGTANRQLATVLRMHYTLHYATLHDTTTYQTKVSR